VDFTVIGAGAIGGTVGAYLARAEKPVLFVDAVRDHVDAINNFGLTVSAPHETISVPARAVLPEDLNEPLDVVLLAVGSADTRKALERVVPLLSPDGYVVSLQNGLNEASIASIVGSRRTVGAFINFSAEYLEPGHVRYYGHGPFFIGELDGRITPRLHSLKKELRSWGEVELTDNIHGYLWTKFGYLNMLFAASLVEEDQANVFDSYRTLMVALGSEFYELALLEGIEMPSVNGIAPKRYVPVEKREWIELNESLDEMIEYMRIHQKPRSPLVGSLKSRKHPREVYYVFQEAFNIAKRHRKEMALSHRLCDLIRDVEEGRRKQGRHNLNELDALRQSQGQHV
jgi:2-dehydropantoate 2-reductase